MPTPKKPQSQKKLTPLGEAKRAQLVNHGVDPERAEQVAAEDDFLDSPVTVRMLAWAIIQATEGDIKDDQVKLDMCTALEIELRDRFMHWGEPPK